MGGDTGVLAQVFAVRPEILASASVSESAAKALENAKAGDARILRVDRAGLPATRLVDVIFKLERTPAPSVGEFVTIRLTSTAANKVAVPKTAILDSATGTFVYVVNGEFFLRTAVKVGIASGDFIEITDGLYAGDKVVASPVDQLWLAELRLTKGGGHSH
jgi:multidrug efflux pump subunit AcrA (membrane-fusion protein)